MRRVFAEQPQPARRAILRTQVSQWFEPLSQSSARSPHFKLCLPSTLSTDADDSLLHLISDHESSDVSVTMSAGFSSSSGLMPANSARAKYGKISDRRPREFLEKAGEGNRTLVCSLGSCRSTIELHPREPVADSCSLLRKWTFGYCQEITSSERVVPFRNLPSNFLSPTTPSFPVENEPTENRGLSSGPVMSL